MWVKHKNTKYKIKTSKQKHWLEKWQRVKSKTPIFKQNKDSRERCYNLCSTLFTFLSLCVLFSSDAVFWSISLQLLLRGSQRGMTLMRSLNGLTNRIIMQDVIKIWPLKFFSLDGSEEVFPYGCLFLFAFITMSFLAI